MADPADNHSHPGAGAVRGYVLAGGESSRFGSDKALHQYEGSPLCVHAASALPCEATLVVANSSPEHRATGLAVIEDRVPGRGPVGGLHTALHDAAEREAAIVLLVACDMPWLDAELLEWLSGSLIQQPETAALSPRLEGRWEPLHAAYRVRLALPVVDRALAERRGRMQSLMDSLDAVDATRASPFPPARWLASCRSANTPDALESE